MAIGSVAQGKINAEIVMKLDSLNAGIAQANAKIKAFSRQATRDSQANAKAMSAAWKAGFAVISVYAIKAAGKVVNAFKDMVNTYAEFEQSLANTQSVARASAEELDAMEKAARRVGATTRSTASQAANALYYLASAGFTAKESIDALDGVNALAIATQSDLARTSETVATTIKQYGLETSAATDIANTFTAAITSSLATMNKLTKSFEYVGPIAAGLGLTVEETTGALELLYNKGFSGEKAGRGLRSILVDLADSTSVVNKKLGKMGISFDKVNPATNKLADIMDTLRENGVSAANSAAIFGKVSGVQLASLISIASTAKGGMVELTNAVTGTNRAFEAMAIQMDTLKGSMDKFKNAEEALRITTGKGLAPALSELIDIGTGVIKIFNKLPSSSLAAASVFGTIAAAATLISVAIVGLQVALSSAVIAPVIAAITALAVPLTFVAAGTVAVVAGFRKIETTQFEHAREQFKGVAEEIKFTVEALDNVNNFSKEIHGNFEAIGHYDFSKIRGEIDKLAKSYGLTEKQVFALVKADKELSAVAKSRIVYIEREIAEGKEYLAYAEGRSAKASDYANIEIQHAIMLNKLKKESNDADDKAYEQSQVAQDATDRLKTAFARATELQILLGDQFDRNAYLTDIFNGTLKDMVNSGMLATDEAIIAQKKLWLDLQDATSKVTDEQLTASQKNAAALDRLHVRLEQNRQSERLANETRTEYNKKLEDSNAVMEYFNYLISQGFTVQGAAMKIALEDYGDMIVLGKDQITLTAEYQEKLKDLGRTERERIVVNKEAALENLKYGSEEYEAIKAYYKEVLRLHDLETDKEKVKILNEYSDKLKVMDHNALQRVEDERAAAKEKAIQLVKLGKISKAEYIKMTKDIDAYYDKLESKAAWNVAIDNIEKYSSLAFDVFSAITDAKQAQVDANIAQAQREYDETVRIANDTRDALIEGYKIEKEDALAAAGLVADDQRQRLLDSLEGAKKTGDLINVERAEDAITRYDIEQQYLDDVKAANDAADAAEEAARLKKEAVEKKARQDQYKIDVAKWNARKLGIIVDTSVAVMKGYADYGLIVGSINAAAMGIIGAAQWSAAESAKPVAPTFADGGVIPGSSYKGDSTEVLANAGEVILNQAQQDAVATQLNQDDRPINITINSILDGKVVATNSAKYYRNGQVKL